uniref:Spindle and kinetochore-associated protein 3 isoform X1 n=2 Tax=Geotrypetes seraphini TaxID=260995 RepID=A0A6P8RL99_GEOSA|nr:spindle and kinetochore-associated protein 3 isoform X1 [Geotrypetes seraphini]
MSWRALPSLNMTVTAHFFGKLRALALTLEKETHHLEHAFNNDDLDFNGYEDESPMRVLHDLHSEVRALKRNIQSSTDQVYSKAEEITEFLKAYKVLKQRTAMDLENIKVLFEKYGYKPLSVEDQVNEQESGCDNPDISGHEHLHKTDQEQMENKLPAPRDLPQIPQLSAFGLSHYQFHARTVTNIAALNGIANVKEDPKNIQVPVMPRTPKCTLYMEDDALLESCFPKLEPFSIAEYHMKLNDDYTMALINRAQEKKNVPEGKSNNVHARPPVFFCDITTPVLSSQLSHMSGAANLNSPLPPIFCTPGIKIHKKENIKPVETPGTAHPSNDGLTPPAHSFQSQCLQNEAVQTRQTAPEVLPNIDKASEKLCLEDPALLVMRSGRYLEESALRAFPVKTSIDANQLGTPQRPDMTISITEDATKYHMKIAPSPLKISDYEKMLQTPQRPEMTSSLMSDILKVLPNYYRNITTPTPVKIESIKGAVTRHEGKMNSKHINKETV